MKKSITLLALACMGYVPYAGAQVVFSEDFEGTSGTALPSGWTQTNVGPSTWKTGTNTTLQSTDFQVEAHTRMVGFNDDAAGNGVNNNSQLLKLPAIDLTTVTNPYLSYDQYYFAGTYQSIQESMTIEVSTNGGTNWTVLQTVTGNTVTPWETRYVSLSAYAGMANVMIGFRYDDNNGWLFGAMLDNIQVFTPTPNDIGITGVTPAPGSPTGFGLVSTTVPVGGTVFNNGGTAITSFTVTYSVNGGPVVSTPISSVNIAPFTSYTFTATPASLPAAAGVYSLEMAVTLTGDANNTNDSMDSEVGAAVFMPNKKLVFEEGTGTWCGWCPRGAVFMDTMQELHGDEVSLIAVHNSDPMTVTAYDAKIGTMIGGYPSVVVDRRGETDPSTLIAVYNAQSNYFGFADVTIGNITTTSSTITVPVTVKPAIPLSGDYRLALVITEDGVHAPSNITGKANTWAQHNYYAGGTQNLIGDGVNWKLLDDTVAAEDMHYDFVARSISNVDGNPGSLPATMVENTDYSYTFNAAPVNAGWNQNSLKVVVLLIRNSDGQILNSQNEWSPTGVANVNKTISGVKLYPNPTTDNATLAFTLQHGGNGTIQVTDAIGRVVFSNSQVFGSGEQFLTIPTANLAAGIYNVRVETKEGAVIERLTVVK